MPNTVLKIVHPVCLAGKERCVRGWRGAAVLFKHSRDCSPVRKFFVARDIDVIRGLATGFVSLASRFVKPFQVSFEPS